MDAGIRPDTRRSTVRAEVMIEIVPGATHLFPEPGALEHVAAHAAGWFASHLQPALSIERL